MVSTSKVVGALAERRDDLRALVSNANRTTQRDRRRAARRSPRAGTAPGRPAPRQQHAREPARHARRPRPARGGVEPGDPRPGPLRARTAPAAARRARRWSPTCACWSAAPPACWRTRRRSSGAAASAFDSTTQALRDALPFSRSAVPTARARGLISNYGALSSQLRRQRPLRARHRELQRLRGRRERRPARRAAPAAARGAPRRLHVPVVPTVPGRRDPASPRTAPRRGATRRGALDCDRIARSRWPYGAGLAALDPQRPWPGVVRMAIRASSEARA